MYALAAQSIQSIAKRNPQGLSTTAWSWSTLGYMNRPFFHAIAAQSLQKLPEFLPQELSSTAWAYAVMQLTSCEPLRHATASAAVRQAAVEHSFGGDAWGTQSLANTAWSMSNMFYTNLPMMASIAAASVAR